jgi:hypothetical protein
MPCISQSVFSLMIRIARLMSAMSQPSPLPAWALAGDDFSFETVAGKIFIAHGRRSRPQPHNQEFVNSPARIVGNSGLNLTGLEQSVNLSRREQHLSRARGILPTGMTQAT